MVRRMIDVLVDEGISFEPPKNIKAAILAACDSAGFKAQTPSLCVRFASDQAVRNLNQQWRKQDKVTDVLSFPMQEAPFDLSLPLGDMALAVPFIVQEAARLQLPTADHCLHLIIHATLHLLGFDHIDDDEASRMQALEQRAMHNMGLFDPYPAMETTA